MWFALLLAAYILVAVYAVAICRSRRERDGPQWSLTRPVGVFSSLNLSRSEMGGFIFAVSACSVPIYAT